MNHQSCTKIVVWFVKFDSRFKNIFSCKLKVVNFDGAPYWKARELDSFLFILQNSSQLLNIRGCKSASILSQLLRALLLQVFEQKRSPHFLEGYGSGRIPQFQFVEGKQLSWWDSWKCERGLWKTTYRRVSSHKLAF